MSGRFDVLFLVGEAIVAHVSLAAFFKWDLRAVVLLGGVLPSFLMICFIDAWHLVFRRDAWMGVLLGFIAICALICIDRDPPHPDCRRGRVAVGFAGLQGGPAGV